jgi:hypothetical protein
MEGAGDVFGFGKRKLSRTQPGGLMKQFSEKGGATVPNSEFGEVQLNKQR